MVTELPFIRRATPREQRIEKYRQTMRNKREARFAGIVETEKEELLPLTNKELYIGGLLLYWGEGLKSGAAIVSLSNTNPEIMRFFRNWLTENMSVPEEKLKARLHLYQDMDQQKELLFWSEIINVAPNKFLKPFIKATTLRGLTYKGFGHGTCEIRIGDVKLKEKILAGIQIVAPEYKNRKSQPNRV